MSLKDLERMGIQRDIAEILVGKNTIKTLKQVIWIHRNLPFNKEVGQAALAKAKELMTTFDEAKWVYEHSSSGSELNQIAIEFVKNLYLKKGTLKVSFFVL